MTKTNLIIDTNASPNLLLRPLTPSSRLAVPPAVDACRPTSPRLAPGAPMPCREPLTIMSTNELGEYCSPEQLRDQLKTSKSAKSLLVIDCRSQSEFARSHIRGAINIFLPSLMLKRLKRGNLNISSVIQNNEAKEKFTKNFKSATIVLYDDCSTDMHANPSSVINLLLKKLKGDGSATTFLLGGFSTFEERFPENCQSVDNDNNSLLGLCNLRISEPSALEGPASVGGGGDSSTLSTCSVPSPISCPYPVHVMPHLYLGSAKNSADLNQLRNYGITYILNVTANVPNAFVDVEGFHYLQIPISDHWSQNLSSWFPQAIQFIDSAVAAGSGVLVHCLAGISRSVTVTVAYLMARHAMSLNQAYDHVKRCKPNISPNFTFMGQLLDFEKDLSGEAGSKKQQQQQSDGETSDDNFTSDNASPTSSNCSPI